MRRPSTCVVRAELEVGASARPVFVIKCSQSASQLHLMDAMGRPPSASPKSLPVSLRLPPEVKAAAERAAKDDTRSMSSFLEKLLTEHLKAKGYLK